MKKFCIRKVLLIGICLLSFAIPSFCSDLNDQFLKASKAGNLKEVKKLISAGANVNAKVEDGDEYGATALMYAITNCNLGIIKELIKRGADIYSPIDCNYYKYPIEVALSNKCGIEELLKAGVSANLRSYESNKTLLELASDPDVVQILLKYGAKDTPVAALIRNDLENFKVLLKTANQEEKDKALSIAVKQNNIDIVKELVKTGANVNVYYNCCGDYEHVAPLSIALNENLAEMAELLKEAGAKENLFFAVESGNIARVKQSIEKGADVNQKLECLSLADGYTYLPLIGAVESRKIQIAKLLIERGANVNVILYGNTPLMAAEKNSDTEIIKLLKAAGAKE